MFDDINSQPLSDDYVVNRMFDLVQSGATGTEEFAMLDAVIVGRLTESYPVDPMDAEPRSQTADA